MKIRLFIILLLLTLSQSKKAKKDKNKGSKKEDDTQTSTQKMVELLESLKGTEALAGVDMDTFNQLMENAKSGFDVFANKAEEIEKMKAKYKTDIENMKNLHAEMSETQKNLAQEQDQIAQIRQDCEKAKNNLKNCEYEVRDINSERKGWEDTTSRFVQDLKLCDDVIQEEKRKVRNCKKEQDEKHKQEIAKLKELHSKEKQTLQSELKEELAKTKSLKEEQQKLKENIVSLEEDTRKFKGNMAIIQSTHQKKMKSLKTSHESKLAELNSKIDDLEKQRSSGSGGESDQSKKLKDLEDALEVERKQNAKTVTSLHEQISKKYDEKEATIDVRIKRKDEYITHLKQEPERLQKRCSLEKENLRTKITELEEENEKFYKEGLSVDAGKLREQIIQLKSSLDTMKVSLAYSSEKYVKLEEMNTNSVRSINNWTQKYVKCNQNNTKISTENKALKEDYETLTTYTDQQILQNEKLKGQVESITKKLDDVHVDWKNRVGAANKETEDGKDREKTLKDKNNDLQKSIDARNDIQKNSNDMITSLNNQIASVTKERDTVKQDMESNAKHNTQKVNELLKEIHNLRQKDQPLSTAVNTCEQQLKTKVIEAKAKDDQLKQKDEQYQILRTSNRESNSELAFCVRKRDLLESSLKARDVKIKEISNNCSTLAKCEFAKNRVEVLYTKALKDCKCVPVNKTDSEGRTEIVRFETDPKEVCIKEIEKYEKCQNQLIEIGKRLVTLEDGKLKLTSELKDSKDKCTKELKQGLTKTKQLEISIKEAIKKCDLEKDAMESKHGAQRVEITKQHNNLAKNVENAQKTLEESSSKFESAQKELKKCQETFKNCEEMLESDRKKSDQCQQDFTKLVHKHKTVQLENTKQIKQLEDCKKEKDMLNKAKNALDVMLKKKGDELKQTAKVLGKSNSDALENEAYFRRTFQIAAIMCVIMCLYILYLTIKSRYSNTQSEASYNTTGKRSGKNNSKKESKKKR